MVGDWEEPRIETRSLLEEAVERTDDAEARYHIRQAMQILYDEQRSKIDV
ncbi:MAG: hypothetical protein ACI9PP_000232 [Halobacteriales archaeon]|jgi:hypothetical protein